MNPVLLETIRQIERNDENPYFEIVDGQIALQPPKTVFASVLASQLSFQLASRGRAHELGYVIIRALFQLSKSPDLMRRPDVAFVSTERWPRSRCFSHDAIEWDVIPNLAIDSVNPEDRAETIVQKIADYLAAGVEMAWVIYPQLQQIWVCEWQSSIRVLTENDVLDGGEVLPLFRVPLKELFHD